jgi:hypothetical protein
MRRISRPVSTGPSNSPQGEGTRGESLLEDIVPGRLLRLHLVVHPLLELGRILDRSDRDGEPRHGVLLDAELGDVTGPFVV